MASIGMSFGCFHLLRLLAANNFSLFHEEFRCRQPYLAMLFIVLLCFVIVFLIYKAFRSDNKNQPSNNPA